MSARFILPLMLSVLVLISCQKELSTDAATLPSPVPTPPPVTSQWVEHVIVKGEHNSDKNPFKQVSLSEIKFQVQFNNSAIYQTLDSNNQRDINKLYGFADNNQDHHTNSARIGWRWYQNELQLFGYTYNNTVLKYQMIKAVPLNKEINCNIKVTANNYIFNIDSTQITMLRTAATPKADGYQLYPYFGGDEVAPHDIRIKIKDL
jgi:hypothetical protein